MMPEKLANSATQWVTRRVGVLLCLTFLAMLMVWSIDQSAATFLADCWRYPQKADHSATFGQNFTDSVVSYVEINSTHVKFNVSSENPDGILVKNVTVVDGKSRVSSGFDQRLSGPGVSAGQSERDSDPKSEVWSPKKEYGEGVLDWISVELEKNYSSKIVSRWMEPGGEPCKDSKTVDIKFVNLNFDDDEDPIVLSTGTAHEVVFQAVDEAGNPHCLGGDYFEVDLSGKLWKSRPPTNDMGNGTYSFALQVHPNFAGVYHVTITLLFRHFEGLKFSTARNAYDLEIRKLPIVFTKSEAKLPDLQVCMKSDFQRDVWTGRWTRHGKNDACEISNDGRFRCLDYDYPCTAPWCYGSLGMLESNGWVYSAHCSFRLFSADDAWNCLNNRWLFFWGDSNHVDTIRNLMFFFLGVPYKELVVVSRHFDRVFTNPKDKSQCVRITNLFNGHWNMTMNYQGLDSLLNDDYRDLLKSYFNGSSVPDTVIFNSGLHDGVHFRNIKKFIGGVDDAVLFWKEIMDDVKKIGLEVSNFIFRSTITTAGYARRLAFNPSKMEAFNGILLEKLREAGLVTAIVDDFDMTWPWHFDNRCNDGVHYGRFPEKRKWRDGEMGHEYFVDLMLGQVLFNAICAH